MVVHFICCCIRREVHKPPPGLQAKQEWGSLLKQQIMELSSKVEELHDCPGTHVRCL